MKKFLFRVAVYFVALAVITLSVNMLYVHKLRKIDGTAKMLDVPNNIQICNFGSSHGQNGFNYEDASKKYVCFNFAMGSQSLVYDYKIMQNYKDKIGKGAKVFLLASYFSLFGMPEVYDPDFDSKNKRYYRFLPPEYIVQYSARTDFYVHYFPALAADTIMSLVEILFAGYGNDGWAQTAEDYAKNPQEASLWGRKRFDVHFEGMLNTRNGKRIIRRESMEAIYGMINLCRELEAVPILVTMPFLKEYTNPAKEYDPSFLGDFYGVIQKIVSDTGIKYYDYSTDERFSHDYSLFMNMDHLNRKGARKFTDILLLEALSIDVMPPE